MFQEKNKFAFLLIISVVLTFGLTVSFQSLFAWTPPTVNPPGSNVDAPVNVGGSTQTKTGMFHVKNWFTADTNDNTFVVDGSLHRVGIGTLIPTQKLDVVGNIKLSGSLECVDCIDEIDVVDVIKGAESRCNTGEFLDGDGQCKTANDIVTAGSTGGSTVPSDMAFVTTYNNTGGVYLKKNLSEKMFTVGSAFFVFNEYTGYCYFRMNGEDSQLRAVLKKASTVVSDSGYVNGAYAARPAYWVGSNRIDSLECFLYFGQIKGSMVWYNPGQSGTTTYYPL